jgi:RimJ/RimL family protein N-acetyltransferase
MSPAIAETARLRLREFTTADVDDLLRSDGDARVMRYLANGLAARTREEVSRSLERMARAYAERPGFGLLHASLREGGAFVGGCGLFQLPEGEAIEIAYRLPVACWGQGYATEMARAVLAHGFGTLGLARVIGLTWPENLPSQRVLEKIGMRRTGVEEHYGRPMIVFEARRADSAGR